MTLDATLHQTFLSQLNTLIITLERKLADESLNETNADEYQKQFIELSSAIHRFEEYTDVYHLLELKTTLPKKAWSFFSMLLKSRLRAKDSYTEQVEQHFREMATQLKNVWLYLRELKVE